MLRDDGLKPISEELSLSMATIKTHLQHIFAKTDTHRQAELVRLFLTIVPQQRRGINTKAGQALREQSGQTAAANGAAL